MGDRRIRKTLWKTRREIMKKLSVKEYTKFVAKKLDRDPIDDGEIDNIMLLFGLKHDQEVYTNEIAHDKMLIRDCAVCGKPILLEWLGGDNMKLTCKCGSVPLHLVSGAAESYFDGKVVPKK